MQLTRWIPTLSLGVVLGVVLISTCSEPPVDFPYTEPPEGDPPPAVELATGDVMLHVHVTDPDGQALAGAGVSLDQRGRPIYGWTDASGDVMLTEVWGEPADVRVVALGFEATVFRGIDPTGTSSAAPRLLVLERRITPPAAPPDLELSDLVGRVQLPARSAGGEGEPYELLFTPTTAPTDATGGFPRRVAVEPDGSFTVPRLHEGPYRVTLLSPEDRGGSAPDLLSAADGTPKRIEHDADAETAGLDLVATAGSIRGRVLEPRDADGEAVGVRGALLRAERILDEPSGAQPRLDRGTFRATRTDGSGAFSLDDLAPGRYRVTLVAGRRRQERRVDVDEHGEIDLVLEPEETQR